MGGSSRKEATRGGCRGVRRVASLVLVAACLTQCITSGSGSPLSDYVQTPDSHYTYTVIRQLHRDNYTLHVLNMTSQKWMDESFSSRPVWWHFLTIVTPKDIEVKDTAFLWVGQGHNTDKIPDESDRFLALVILLAVTSKSVAAIVDQVPNQPTVFTSDPHHRRRSEDAVVAWSMKMYLARPNQPPHTLVHLPMAKAVVRAMDTIDDFTHKTHGHRIRSYFLTGASKRGWTTWLTSAVDKRIVGMAPVVFDLLNMQKTLHHQFRSLGGWTFAFKEYLAANVTSHLDTPTFTAMAGIIDPLVYKNRYTMPTYMVKATGDEFFLLDETSLFYRQLTGPQYLRVFPNCEHTLINQLPDVFLALRSFYLHAVHAATYPHVAWAMTATGLEATIRVTLDRPPLEVIVRHATTIQDKRRDFRWFEKNPKGHGDLFQPVLWFKGPKATQLTPTEFEAKVKAPLKGWTAFFIEVYFPGVNGTVLEFTSEVNVVPDTLPFPDCHGLACKGRLV